MHTNLPPGAKVVVISKGDPDLLKLDGRQGWHFPQTGEGIYAGHHPGCSDEAIAQLEALRRRVRNSCSFPPRHFGGWTTTYGSGSISSSDTRRLCVRWTLAQSFRLTPRIQPLYHTFSVVICTYKRAEYVGKAIESLFNQDYPKDKYEIILINNDSPDNTEEVVNRYAACSPVPFSYHVEKRNGLSFARNLGIAKARLDYVAYLDDDAVACPNWLTSFNTVINDHKALVVGGRIETVYEDGFVPPDWFNYQYVKGFFGINYRNWGKKEHVFRVRQPYYLVGCNCIRASTLPLLQRLRNLSRSGRQNAARW